MSYCTIYFPGLLGPDVPLEELPKSDWPRAHELPSLSLLLNRGDITAISKAPLERRIFQLLGYVLAADDELPVAAARQPESRGPGSTCWCLDPVFVQLDREVANLAAYSELVISEPEALELIASLNRHFAGELHIEYLTPQHWLVKANLSLHTATPSEAMFVDIKRFQPSGSDAKRWQSLLNEMQMLLHAHPVNEARLHANMPPINSLWLWGGGTPVTTAPGIDLVCANDELVIAAAGHNHVAHAPLPAQIDATLFLQQNVLLVLLEQVAAIQQRNVYAWFDALRDLERKLLTPVLALVKRGALEYVVLHSDTLQITIGKKQLKKWWRRIKSCENTIMGLRQRYGH